MLIQFIVNGFITGILYSLSALGFALVYHTTRIFHIAASAIYVAATYFLYFAYHTAGLPMWFSALLSLTSTALLSIICDWLIYRPQYRKQASLNILMISSIGLTTVLVNAIALIFGNETKILNNSVQSNFRLGNLIITFPQVIQVTLGGVALVIFILFINLTKFGLKIKALGSDKVLFETLGFDIASTRTIVFGLSGIFLAIGACLTFYDIGMDPYTGMPLLINAMVAMIIGGIGRFGACIAGGIFLGIIQALAVYQFSSNWQIGVTFFALLLFLFFRPQGIFGYKKRLV